MAHTIAPGLQLPEERIPLWLASLKAEQYATRTIEGYRAVVEKYLSHYPVPNSFGIQHYLADSPSKVSSARVSMERKELRSFLKFLHSVSIWQTDPIANIKSIMVRHVKRFDITVLSGASWFNIQGLDKL